MALDDMKVVDNAVGISVTLDEQEAKDGNDAVAKVRAMATAGERFAVLDLPGDLVNQVALASKDLKITLINTTAPEDALRSLCLPTLACASAFICMHARARARAASPATSFSIIRPSDAPLSAPRCHSSFCEQMAFALPSVPPSS